MTDRRYRVTKLAAEFDLTTFDCGEPAYNQWLSEHARTAVESGSSMVYLLLERMRAGIGERVVRYYAICPTMVVRSDLPRPFQRGVLRWAPAWLLARQAMDQSLRRDVTHKWGAQLLREALRSIIDSPRRWWSDNRGRCRQRGSGQLVLPPGTAQRGWPAASLQDTKKL